MGMHDILKLIVRSPLTLRFCCPRELEGLKLQSRKARRWRRALRLELGPDLKLSELNLQGKLNQPSGSGTAVGSVSDLAKVAVRHSSARQSVVCVIE